MVKAPLVVPDFEFGMDLLERLDQAGHEPTAAAWLKREDDWTLFVGLPEYDDHPRRAYGYLIQALEAYDHRLVADYPIRLQGNNSELIKDLRKAYGNKRKYGAGTSIGGRYYGPWWYGEGILLRAR